MPIALLTFGPTIAMLAALHVLAVGAPLWFAVAAYAAAGNLVCFGLAAAALWQARLEVETD